MGKTVYSTPQHILMSGNLPAKPSVLVNKDTVGGEKCKMYKMSYMLSQDFIEYDSKSELVPAYQYEPDSVPRGGIALIEKKENYPKLAFGPVAEVYLGVERFLKRRAKFGKDFRASDNRNFLFSTKIDFKGRILYLYAFSNTTIWSHEMMGMIYNPDVQGTPLEKKLMAALDEVARTYQEIKKR